MSKNTDAPGQLVLDFSSPIDHHEQLFRHQSDEIVIWHRDRIGLNEDERPGPVWQTVKPSTSHAALVATAGGTDKYVTPNEFFGWRLMKLLRGLNAIYLDFDSHGRHLTQEEIVAWRDEVLQKIRDHGWPEPTFSVLTGRGFHLYWCHHREERYALPRWQSLARHMCGALDADAQSIDCCREMRIVGTRNSKATEGFIVHGRSHSGQVYGFDFLYETICKPQKLEVRQREAARKRTATNEQRTTKRDAPANPKKFSNVLSWWMAVHDDIWKIAGHLSATNRLRGVPEGARISLLEILAAALCWFRPADQLEDEILHCGRQLMPSLTDEEILRDTKTLRQHAIAAAAGETTTFNGKTTDPRYKYSRKKIWSKIGRHVPESLYAQMQAIVPDAVFEERDQARRTEADAARDRVKEGRYKASNTNEGYRTSNALNRSVARQMFLQKVPVARIAKLLNADRKTIDRWVKS